MSWDGMWEKGMVLAMWQDGPGHLITDTGMQLLTRCGRRVTYLGAQVDTTRWFRVDQPGCFECQPSPMVDWAQQSSEPEVVTIEITVDASRAVRALENAHSRLFFMAHPDLNNAGPAHPGEGPAT